MKISRLAEREIFERVKFEGAQRKLLDKRLRCPQDGKSDGR